MKNFTRTSPVRASSPRSTRKGLSKTMKLRTTNPQTSITQVRSDFEQFGEEFRSYSAAACLELVNNKVVLSYVDFEKSANTVLWKIAMGASWAEMKGGKDVNWGSITNLCQEMMTKWIDFVEKHNAITTEGNFAIMKGQLEKMQAIMNDLSSFFTHGNYRGDQALSEIGKARKDIVNLRRKVNLSETERTKLHTEKILETVKTLNSKISNLFTNCISKTAVPRQDGLRARLALSQLSGDFVRIVEATNAFASLSARMLGLIMTMNSSFTNLLAEIGIPCEISLEFEKEEPGVL